MEFCWLYINSEYRRKGIATKLIKEFLKNFKNIVWVSFWTGKDLEKEKAYGLYKKLGLFEPKKSSHPSAKIPA